MLWATHMGGFETTHWSIVRAAGSDSTGRSRDALAQLCGTYWEPLYAYLRRQGHRAEDAEDLTQGFFARVLEKGVLDAADPTRGRFRSFLLASLRHYAANERAHAEALKRGGSVPALPLEFDGAERRYLAEPEDTATPERLFDRRWALALLDRAMVRLAAEYRQRGKHDLFESLKAHLIAPDEGIPYSEIASRLGSSEGATRVAAHRLRRRFGDLLRGEVARTVDTADEVEDELRHLIQAVGRG